MLDQPLHHSPGSAAMRFTWLRESAPGHLEFDSAISIAQADLLLAVCGLHPAQQRITAQPPVACDALAAALSGSAPFDTLPPWALKRLSILLGPLATDEQRAAAIAPSATLIKLAGRIQPAAEVHLPYIDRRSWPERFEILEQTQFAPNDEYNVRLMIAASLEPGVAGHLVFEHRQTVAAALLKVLLPSGSVEQNDPSPTPVSAHIRMKLALAACRAWSTAPLESSRDYFTVHAPVSVAVQTAMRRWLAWCWLADPACLDNVQQAPCSLIFPARPFLDAAAPISPTT